MRPVCCDQPEILTQGYYPRVESIAVNAAPRRRVLAPEKKKKKTYKTSKHNTDVVVGVSRAQRWAGGMVCFL